MQPPFSVYFGTYTQPPHRGAGIYRSTMDPNSGVLSPAELAVEAVNPSFRVDIEGLPFADFEREAFAHRLPVFVIGMSPDYPDPHAVAFEFFHSKGLFPRAQAFADPELDRLEEEASAEPDPAVRVAEYVRLEELAGKRAYQIYTDHHPHVRAHCVHLRGVEGDHTMGGLGFANLLYWPALSRD